jgi:hypothetical protein
MLTQNAHGLAATEVEGDLATVGYLLSGTLLALMVVAAVVLCLVWRAGKR